MNYHIKMRRLASCCIAAGSLLFSACESGMDADMEEPGTALPDGKYPLTFTASQTGCVPHTRVSDADMGGSHTSSWDGGEVINVRIGNDSKTGSYTLKSDGTIDPAQTGTPLYWQNTSPATVTAWYSNIAGQSTVTGNTVVSLADQSSALAYVLKATATDVDYKSSPDLQFQHQLAKIRVTLTGERAADVTSVSVKAHTACTVNGGDVTPGPELGYIAMRQAAYGSTTYWEANVTPQSQPDLTDFIRLNGSRSTAKAAVSGITSLQAGHVYTIALTVNKKKTTFDISTEDVTITDDDEYTVVCSTGTSTHSITINGSPKVTLRDVVTTAEPAIKIESGTPTIVIEGENTFDDVKDSSAISLMSENANVIIDGNDSGKLNINGNNDYLKNDAIIGGCYNAAAGNITIQNLILDIDCSNARWINAAIIGCGHSKENICSIGDIVIRNTDLTIKAKTLTGAFIGTGLAQGGQTKCGTIDITLKGGMTKADFLNKLTATTFGGSFLTQQPEKVGKGGILSGGTSTCGTVTWH